MNLFEILKPLLQILFSQAGFMGVTETKALHLSKEILQQLRRIVILLSVTLGGLLLFLLGMHFLVLRLLDQLDQGSFTLTPSILFLFIFILTCLGTIIYSVRTKTWLKSFEDKTTDNSTSQNRIDTAPIESAISLFILDLVKEREWKRAQESQKNESSRNSN